MMPKTNYYYFTEQPYTGYDPELQEQYPALRLNLPNANYDPQIASDLYNRYHDEYQVADDVGFDGIMINEHHTAPFCMQASINITGAVLAKITRRGKILMLGNPLPVVDNPLRLAEELAMIDCISRGRLISGFVRGGGVESLVNNVNPVYNRERFEEAHDLIVAAWTRPGPFRWDGKHFQYRVVNPWALPLQKPHPPIMVPGTASPETVIWAAKHRYPYVVLGSSLEQTKELIAIYRETAKEEGYEMKPEHVGYLIRVFVADSEEKAQAEGHNFFWQKGALNKQIREWMAPPGYATVDVAGIRRLRAISKAFDTQAYQEAQDNYQLILGTPDRVIDKLRYVRDLLEVGHMCLWAHDGYMTHEDTVRCIELLGKEVLPALRGE
jgi:alkanesulfonate monooxygenase SsuD/methylene tetrahydromethanopterin reductase-like flavin-dependent oxidoreductase (luciferase family)